MGVEIGLEQKVISESSFTEIAEEVKASTSELNKETDETNKVEECSEVKESTQ